MDSVGKSYESFCVQAAKFLSGEICACFGNTLDTV